MGKKSKRKAVKAAAAAAGTTSMGGYSNGQLILGPRPDCITCTNDDHKLCALCSSVLPPGDVSYMLRICCGTKVCTECDSEDRCAFCKCLNETAQQAAALTKKRAKKGFPWACHFLADLYLEGMPLCFQQSDWEAVRWYEKGASQNHPLSCVYLTKAYQQGFGCKQDLEKARIMFEKAIRLRAEDYTTSLDPILRIGHKLARFFLENDEKEKGLSLLVPLAKRGIGGAQGLLSALHDDVGDQKGFLFWATVCSENASDPFAALDCALVIPNYALSRCWYGIASKFELDELDEYQTKLLRTSRTVLCGIRQECAWCQTNLDRSTRKMCKGCKAHCYCSEGCQRAHWNAEENDHRSECQKVMEVKKKVAAMKK